ncbi:MAG: hypothetical protein ABEI52_04650 [Halobacteriaceae archaeon]
MDFDPVMIAILIALLLFAFFLYLFARKTAVSYREGVEKGKDR